MRRALCAAVAAIVLTACGTAPRNATVGEAQAIRIAKDRCVWTQPFGASEQWRAALHTGQWHVWLTRDRDPREPVVGALDIWIRASDGEAGRCNRAN